MAERLIRTGPQIIWIVTRILLPAYLGMMIFLFIQTDESLEGILGWAVITALAVAPATFIGRLLAKAMNSRTIDRRGVESTAEVLYAKDLWAHLGPQRTRAKLELSLAVTMPSGATRKVEHAQVVPLDLANRFLEETLTVCSVLVAPDNPRLLRIDVDKTRNPLSEMADDSPQTTAEPQDTFPDPTPSRTPAEKARRFLLAILAVAGGLAMAAGFMLATLRWGGGPLLVILGFVFLAIAGVHWWRMRILRHRGVRLEVPARISYLSSDNQAKLSVRFTTKEGHEYELGTRMTSVAYADMDGALVTVIYDPKNPKHCVIARDEDASIGMFMLIGLIVLMIGVGLMLFG